MATSARVSGRLAMSGLFGARGRQSAQERADARLGLLLAAPAILTILLIAVIPLALRAKGLDPGRLAAALRPQVQVDDRVVFWGRYFFSVPVILQRTRPVEVVDAWTTPSVNLPDTWRRELAAGREFEPASGAGVLLTPGEFQESLARHPGRVWVWVHQDDAKALQLAGFVAVLARGEYVVLQRASP